MIYDRALARLDDLSVTLGVFESSVQNRFVGVDLCVREIKTE